MAPLGEQQCQKSHNVCGPLGSVYRYQGMPTSGQQCCLETDDLLAGQHLDSLTAAATALHWLDRVSKSSVTNCVSIVEEEEEEEEEFCGCQGELP